MKILIADDHAIVREGMKQILRTLPEVCHIEEVSEGHAALMKIRGEAYDLIILDISMPGLSGLDILQSMRNGKIDTPVLMLSFHPQEQYAIRAFKLGASGYLSKDSAFDEMSMAIRKIALGGKYVSASLAEKLFFTDSADIDQKPHDILSEREFQVMIMIARGKSVGEIARELFISDKTVSTYRSRIMEKMGMKTNADLTLYTIKSKLIE